jgi:transcription antitermination factor NusG
MIIPQAAAIREASEASTNWARKAEPARRVDPWYVVRVRPRCESIVARALESKNFPQMAPFYRVRRRWSDRSKLIELPLFPGYVFCQLDPRFRLPILTIPGVVSILSFGREMIPLKVDESEALLTLLESGCEVQPWPFLQKGQRIRIRGGSMNGVEGILADLKNGRRLVVSLSMLQRSVAVEIDRENVEPVL